MRAWWHELALRSVRCNLCRQGSSGCRYRRHSDLWADFTIATSTSYVPKDRAFHRPIEDIQQILDNVAGCPTSRLRNVGMPSHPLVILTLSFPTPLEAHKGIRYQFSMSHSDAQRQNLRIYASTRLRSSPPAASHPAPLRYGLQRRTRRFFQP